MTSATNVSSRKNSASTFLKLLSQTTGCKFCVVTLFTHLTITRLTKYRHLEKKIMAQNEFNNLSEMKQYLTKFEEIMPNQDVVPMMKFVETMLLLHRVVVVSDAYFKSPGTSKGRYFILMRLLLSDSPGGESISELQPFYPISLAAMSGVLDTLEKDDLVERCANLGDRRKVNIRLTDQDRTFIKDFLPSTWKTSRISVWDLMRVRWHKCSLL